MSSSAPIDGVTLRRDGGASAITSNRPTRRALVMAPIAALGAWVLGAHAQTTAPGQQTRTSDIPRGSAPPGTALLIMDFQNEILGFIPAEARAAVIDNASALLSRARADVLPVFHVGVRLRDGYPEVSARNKRFSALKANNMLREGTPGTLSPERLMPIAGESSVTKRRVSAFSTTDLETLLRARGVTRLVLAGITTSGVVLSTLRWAADMDYEVVVVSDACADPDAEVHRVLNEKIFPSQATVVSTQALLDAGWKI